MQQPYNFDIGDMPYEPGVRTVSVTTDNTAGVLSVKQGILYGVFYTSAILFHGLHNVRTNRAPSWMY